MSVSQLTEELSGIQHSISQGCSLLSSFMQRYEESMKETRRQIEEREAQFEEKRKEEWAKLDEERRALSAEIAYEREKLEREKDMMQNIHSFQKTKIKLDVGGTHFTTSLVTLRKDPDSLLAKMFSGRYPLEQDDADGSYFIDRDGRHFHHILNYLRMPEEYEPPKDPQVCDELLKEARYYKLEGLLQLLGDDIDIIGTREVVLPVLKKKNSRDHLASIDDLGLEEQKEDPEDEEGSEKKGQLRSLEEIAKSKLEIKKDSNANPSTPTEPPKDNKDNTTREECCCAEESLRVEEVKEDKPLVETENEREEEKHNTDEGGARVEMAL